MKEVKIEWHPKTRKISQIPKNGLEYAWVTKDRKQSHQFVWCKDFIQDVVCSELWGRKVTPYGFKYSPTENPRISLDAVRLLLANWRDLDFASKIKNCEDFIHQIETVLKMKKSVFVKCKNPPARYGKAGIYMVTSSKRWLKAPPMMSLYTLLLRIGMVHVPGNSWESTISGVLDGTRVPYNPKVPGSIADDDRTLISSGYLGFRNIIDRGDRQIFSRDIKKNYPTKDANGEPVSVYVIHDSCGLVGFTTGSTERVAPYWHRKNKE